MKDLVYIAVADSVETYFNKLANLFFKRGDLHCRFVIFENDEPCTDKRVLYASVTK